MSNPRRRAFVAALVAVLGATIGIAGAGHAYLREWRRAIAWFTFVLGAELVLLSVFTDPATVVGSESSTPMTVSALTSAASALPSTVTGPLLVLLVLSTVDAYRLALAKGSVGENTGPSCPYCGQEVDPELDFCQWCTGRFETAPAEGETAEPRPATHDRGSRQ
ncbi:hypothetical protein C2R22_04765 [Salinigranum rubrum]|uniref:DUF7575 domain-containing protein n=1 Tax=Salinigranum rubrum TaxID=755307 RepID=A0A2I8VGK1_9EURY|nr:zinc ribbon domain-containing protein [Salinigranum rubrum]AUV81056.1 hypothetical protein C2R22_04765 [Salinigranum rubrum]